MRAFLQQLGIAIRLHYRNRMALLYGYLFPAIFLVAFWVLYRHESVPIARHLGELLTVTVLGGACFGLPTSMVGERERGVWRRYRLAPVSTPHLLATTISARYLLLIVAGVLQIALAMAIGMPVPRHPLELWLAFTCVAFAFMGLGLVIAMMADNVPAVQALGQCIFLPMLIIGGVAVPLAALPEWAQHASAFFPGRYAVDALQACATGAGLRGAGFNVAALILIGAAGLAAGTGMFRWDAQQRFAARGDKGWVAVALAAWVAVGLMAEARGRAVIVPAAPRQAAAPPPASPPPARRPEPPPQPPETAPPGEVAGTPPEKVAGTFPGKVPATSAREPASAPEPKAEAPATTAPPVEAPRPTPPGEAPAERPAFPVAGPQSWKAVTLADVDANLIFTRLPSDAGVVTPIAPADEEPDPDVAEEVEEIRLRLPVWGPGGVDDPVQRVRNYLYLPAVADVLQMPVERYVPRIVYERLQQDFSKDDLVKILYWIAMHPTEGDEAAVDYVRDAGLDTNGPAEMAEARERVALYAVKLLGRLTGKIAPS